MSHPHVVEKCIDSQKFLNKLVKIFWVTFEKSTLGVKGLGKILERNIVI